MQPAVYIFTELVLEFNWVCFHVI